MAITVTEFVNVGKRLEELGCKCPSTGMALLPVNIESATSVDQLRQAAEAATIKKLLLADHLPVEEIVNHDQRLPYIKNKNFEWTAPILFVSSSLYSQNPQLVSIALNIISDYAYDFFKGMGGSHTARLDVVIGKEGTSNFRRISYSGPAGGMKEISKAIREAMK